MTTLVIPVEVNGSGSVDMDGAKVTVSAKSRAEVEAVSSGEIVGVEHEGVVTWCRRSGFGLRRIPFGEVIRVWVGVQAPKESKQRIDAVCVEGPQDKVPAKIDLSKAAEDLMRVGEIPLPMYCETLGLPIDDVVFERVASVEVR